MYQAVVVGLGGVGSFALRSLSKNAGGKFLGIERFQLGHEWGSSNGKTRLYRKAYFEDKRYVPWIDWSMEAFRELGEQSNKRLIQECGFLLMGIQDRTTPAELPHLLRASFESAQTHGIEVEKITDIPDRFPHFLRYDDLVGLLEPHAGFLRPEMAMRAAMEDASASATVDIREETIVKELKDQGQFFDIYLQTAGETHVVQAENVVISAGPWTSQLLPEWENKLRVIRQLQTWLDISSLDENTRKLHHYSNLPGWVMDIPAFNRPFFGVPCDDGDSLLKVGVHGRDDVVLDPSARRQVSETDRKETVAAARNSATVAERVPDDQYMIKPCFYTMTKDCQFCIGSPRPRVFAVGGLSGHGFKMAPALGQMMSDFATGQNLDRWDLGFCSPERC